MKTLPETTRRTGSWAAAIVACIVFPWFSHKPLYHSDLWAHLSYGRLICSNRALPATEPFMPLASDVPFVATAWLSQVGGFQTFVAGGLHGLQVFYALLIAASAALLSCVAFRRTQSVLWSFAASGVFLFVTWTQLQIIRPQLAGMLCFAALLWLIDRVPLSRRRHAGIAVLFVLWANLHPSFPAGLILIACYTAGRFLDLWYRTGKLLHGLRDSRTLSLVAAVAVASIAVLLNPYGLNVYLETLAVSSNPNLRSLLDWQSLRLTSTQGTRATVAAAILIALFWFTPRRRRISELLPLLLAGAGMLLTSRMISWCSPLAALAIATHGNAITRGNLKQLQPPSLGTNSQRVLLLTIITCALAFSTLPHAMNLVQRKPIQVVTSTQTPIEAAAIAISTADGDLIFSPNTWGDYLTWISDGRAQVFATSHAHLIPPDVWQDYMTISRGQSGCLEVLSERNVTTVLIGHRRPALVKALMSSPDWTLVATTKRAKVFARRTEKGPQ